MQKKYLTNFIIISTKKKAKQTNKNPNKKIKIPSTKEKEEERVLTEKTLNTTRSQVTYVTANMRPFS